MGEWWCLRGVVPYTKSYNEWGGLCFVALTPGAVYFPRVSHPKPPFLRWGEKGGHKVPSGDSKP